MEPDTPSTHLEEALRYLPKTEQHETSHCHCTYHSNPDWILETDTWSQLETLRRLLCQRPAIPRIPPDSLAHIEATLEYHNGHKLLTSTTSIAPTAILHHAKDPNITPLRLSCWKGDITSLTDITAIVNAANSQLEGCFRPEHRCIDNVIHSAAGPCLRDKCHDLVSAQGFNEPVGSARVTPGYLLPASWVLHTVGPQLSPGMKPQPHHKAQLASCYRSCLDAAESLPDERKVVAFCCISTGIFAFPSELAASIAVETVCQWYQERSGTTITDVIFDTFLEKDELLYRELLTDLPDTSEPVGSLTRLPFPLIPIKVPNPSILKAREWIKNASKLIITAGAGLSAATGLDYTSTSLFEKHFPAFKAKGLRRLYDVFGYNGWDNSKQKWGYFFLHMDMVRKWPESPIYALLHDLVTRFSVNGDYHVRTSNADGFFVKNGFPAERVSTPQGQYAFLQCYKQCRMDAVFSSESFLEPALPHIDPFSQCLTDLNHVPWCEFCGGELTICVRGGGYFNSWPFEEQEGVWKRFLRSVENYEGGDGGWETGNTVVLELGVGLNTPGVIRWPNEHLVAESSSRGVRLIRIGLDASGCVPWELEEDDLALGIMGDIGMALKELVSSDELDRNE